MKKILSMMLAALLFVSLTACSGGGTASTPTDSQPGSMPASDPGSGDPASQPASNEFNLPGHYDFGGKEILIKFQGNWYGFQTPGTSELGDMEIRWKAEVEQKYHCKIVKEDLVAGTAQESLVVRILSGEKVADIIGCGRMDVEKMRISGNLLTDLASDEIKNLGLDLTDPAWNARLTEAMTYNGRVYAVFPTKTEIQNCMFFNRDMLNALDLPDPYQYVMSKEWTYDKFIEYCKAATKNGNYGSGFDNDGLLTMFHNNGGMQLISKLPDGRMKYTGYSQKNVETISYLKEKLVLTNLVPPVGSDNYTMFKEGKLLFMTGPDSYLISETMWGSCDFEVGFLPLPIGPNGDDYSYYLCQWPPCMCISSTNEDPEMAVAFMNAYLAYEKVANPVRERIIRDDWFGNDPQGFEIYMMLKDKMYYDWAIYELGLLDVMYQPIQVFIYPEMSVQATMEGDAVRFENLVNDIYNKNYKP